jgi:cytochrome c oxidase subunit IV
MAHNADNRLVGEAHGHGGAAPHHAVNYYRIFAYLVVLTIITVGVAFIHIKAEWLKVLLALTIATIKACFVAIFFMHLKFEGKLIRFILYVPLVLTVILLCALIPDIVVPALRQVILQ